MWRNPYVLIVSLSGTMTALLAPSLWTAHILFLLPFFALGSLYGAFNLVIFLYSHFFDRLDPPTRRVEGSPRIAILYLTRDDFDERALETVVKLDYPGRETFVLDDSTDPSMRHMIDRLAGKHRIRVLRRPDRKGFKAGAINRALEVIDAEFVAVFDADERVPPDFLERALEYFTDERIAFVQASHYAYNTDRRWTRAMGHGVDLHWKVFQNYRNRHGVVNFLGHGAVLRTSALREVGGIPEVVSEDIALTVEFVLRGYHGVFARGIVCGEAFPETYAAFRRRHKKWAIGTADFLRRYARRITTAPLRWHERLDLFLPVLSLPMTLLLFAFALATSFVDIPINAPLVSVTALAVLAPMLPFLGLPKRQRLGPLAINTVAFMSLFSLSVVYTLRGALGGASFPVTGEQGAGKRTFDYLGDLVVGSILVVLNPFNALGLISLASPALKGLFDRDSV